MEGRRPILVVDDVAMFRELERMCLRPFGAVIEAASGSEARELIARHRPSLVLLDLRLPDCDASELCREIKGRDPDIRVVAIASRGDPDEHEAAVRAGADDVLSKPIARDALVGSVRRFFGRPDQCGLPRARVREPVAISGDVGESSGWVANLSRGGLFIETRAEVASGHEITLRFDLPEGSGSVESTAQVVWRRPETSDHVAGLGVRFLALEGRDARRLERFVYEQGAPLPG